jgi:hypothetical protein
MPSTATPDAQEPKSIEVKQFGVVVAAPAPELLAEKMVLGGLVVQEIVPGGPNRGLEKGDIILTYKTVDDVAMERDFGGCVGRLYNWKTEPLLVLRADEILTVPFPKEP